MPRPPILTDRARLAQIRHRARQAPRPAMFLQEEAASELVERRGMVNRAFTSPAVVAPFADIWKQLMPDTVIVEDLETLDLEPAAHDLVIHALSMHWANDPVGQMIQARRALKPDGLFLAALFGGQTLSQLRAVLAEAESSIRGGLSPRVAPMAEIRDLGGLLQRAGFALPVADSLAYTVTYETPLALMHDLRAMGEANAMAARQKHFTSRRIFDIAQRSYVQAFATADGRIPATFEIIYLAGWAPSDKQPKPLRPGSATSRLAEALGVPENPMNSSTPKPEFDAD